MPKRTLRQQMLARRTALDPSERETASSLIQQTLLSLSLFQSARRIVLYAPIRNEVGTGLIFGTALERGMTVLFPAVSEDSLRFGVVTRDKDLSIGAFGILEPSHASVQMLPQEVDLIVVPAVAFSLQGARLGYGKGFYDRTVHGVEGSGKLVGICYDFQLVDEIPREPHDVRVDVVVTEKRVIYPHLS